ncbi:MAG: hypothetical protein WCJ37_03570 [Syntrophus sp. (in: bacteria)]
MVVNSEGVRLSEIEPKEDPELSEIMNELSRATDRNYEREDLLLEGKISSTEMLRLLKEEEILCGELNRRMQELRKSKA